MLKKVLPIGTISIIIGLYCCTKNGDSTLILKGKTDSVNINNPREIQDAINVNNGKLSTGTLPASTVGDYSLSSSQTSITVNSGGSLILPIIYNSGYPIEDVYIQILGADGSYYTVKPTIVTTASGFSYVTIEIPKNLGNGTFTIQYKVKDSLGNISNMVSTTVEITNVVISCSNSTKEGKSGLTFSYLNLGLISGPVIINYDTYSIPDRIDIYQGTQWLTGTGSNPNSLVPPMCDCGIPLPGFVGQSGSLQFNYDPAKGNQIVVVVSGCLNKSTTWTWTLVKAPQCN